MDRPEGPIFDAVVRYSDDGVVLVRLSGELDCATAPRLRDVLETESAAGTARIIVDIRALTFIDPSGARPLVEISRDQRTSMTVRGATGRVARAFELLGLADLLS